LVGGGAPPVPKKSATTTALRGRRSSLKSMTCFKSFSAKNLRYEDMHVHQLFVAVVFVFKFDEQLL